MDHLIDDSDRLKPCPFCGAEAEIITLEGETDEPSIGAQCVQCTSSACGAASGLIYPLMDDSGITGPAHCEDGSKLFWVEYLVPSFATRKGIQ